MRENFTRYGIGTCCFPKEIVKRGAGTGIANEKSNMG
jgi:hypothetical protein